MVLRIKSDKACLNTGHSAWHVTWTQKILVTVTPGRLQTFMGLRHTVSSEGEARASKSDRRCTLGNTRTFCLQRFSAEKLQVGISLEEGKERAEQKWEELLRGEVICRKKERRVGVGSSAEQSRASLELGSLGFVRHFWTSFTIRPRSSAISPLRLVLHS